MWYLFTGRFRLIILKGRITRIKMSGTVKSKKKKKAAVKEGRLASYTGFVHVHVTRVSVVERLRLILSLICRRNKRYFLNINKSLFPRCCGCCAAALPPPHLVRPGEKRAALEDSGKIKLFFHWLWRKNLYIFVKCIIFTMKIRPADSLHFASRLWPRQMSTSGRMPVQNWNARTINRCSCAGNLQRFLSIPSLGIWNHAAADSSRDSHWLLQQMDEGRNRRRSL